MILSMQDLAPVIAATWPPERVDRVGPFVIPTNSGGGNRVRAARLADPTNAAVTLDDISAAATQMDRRGQPILFMVLNDAEPLDRMLSTQGYTIKDPTLALAMPTADLAKAPPPVTSFEVWPPLAIQDEIWTEGGIGPDRLAIMDRAEGAKISLFGRINDRPAGTAYVAIHDGIAMLHALEVSPAARRLGLARHMMRAAGHWAQHQGADTLSLLVTRANQPARGLYTSLGFEPVGHYHYRARTALNGQP